MTAEPTAEATGGTRPRTRTAALTVSSGITPSGRLTLGNYLGALRRFVDQQRSVRGHYFIADLHAMTIPHRPARLASLTRQTAALYLAAGLDPAHSTVFVQSHVPAHAELAYLLECTGYIGELQRMVQFRQKGRDTPMTRVSLLTYPCLMAADILLYRAEQVPVGADQDQHVELARNLAVRFNRQYGETFTVPSLVREPVAGRIADLSDPTRKMSKTDPDDAAGVIRLLDDPGLIRRKVSRAVTDSGSEVRYDPAAKPGVSNLLTILAASTGAGEPAELDGRISSYARLKDAVTDAVIALLEPVQRRYRELVDDATGLDAALAAGAERAAVQAAPVLRAAKTAIGLAR
ncbi:MAG TPA: tryptophan--tRNA ligase [Pseudonocardiaceae bacterium]|nr:tryptophan--tRNA ligase [Pseudonocardiaceae bacterium]